MISKTELELNSIITKYKKDKNFDLFKNSLINCFDKMIAEKIISSYNIKFKINKQNLAEITVHLLEQLFTYTIRITTRGTIQKYINVPRCR